MKIYTKTGDGGTTSLFGARRVDKNSARIAAYGEVDELNSLIGVILAELTPYPDCHSGERSDSRIDSGQVLRPRSGPFKDREFNRTARMTIPTNVILGSGATPESKQRKDSGQVFRP